MTSLAVGIAPFAPLLVGALLAAVTRGGLRGAVMVAAPLWGALNIFALGEGAHGSLAFFDHTLTLARVDPLSTLFGYLFHLAAFIGAIFALQVRDTVQHVAALMYAASGVGAVFAGDLVVLFVFWELMALTSVFLVLARRTPRAQGAALRYLVIQVLSGVILLAGILVRVEETGSIAFEATGLDGLAAWLILLAFGIKCAFPLLHGWLTDAYPEATATGTVFLSAFTTKAAVYALARGYPGTELLVYVGAVMTMFPIFYAVIENDLRRVLAYSMINQVGFMVCGIGIGTAMAINGAISHAFNDVIFKGLLFMSMGAVLERTGTMNGSELGGLYKSMPATAGLCIVGAASISAFPLFSGFVSKSMVMVAALEEGHPMVWLALLFASAGVFHHAGIKIPFFAFFAHDAGFRVKEAPWNMLLAMAIAAAICVFNGSYPWLLYSMLPFPVDYQPYTAAHVLTQIQLLFFSALAFCWLKLSGLYPPEMPGVNIDAEWSYRWLFPRAARRLNAAFAPLDWGLRAAVVGGLVAAIAGIQRHTRPGGALARSGPVGAMVLWAVLLLGVFLVLYFVAG